MARRTLNLARGGKVGEAVLCVLSNERVKGLGVVKESSALVD
jgi:hypothetical protein